MIYDSRDWETVKDIWPARVYDANGQELHNVIACDTETGWVLVQLHYSNGVPITVDDVIQLAEDHRPAPLLVIR